MIEHVDQSPASQKTLDISPKRVLAMLLPVLANTKWEAADLEQSVRDFCDLHSIQFGSMCRLLRAAIMGAEHSPPIYAIMEALGREDIADRLKDNAE